MNREQELVCARFGVKPDVPEPLQKLGIAPQTLHLEPLNGLRHRAEGSTCGWFSGGGTELSHDPDFFVPLHVTHMSERCPQVVKYLALPPGWRFLAAPDQEDIWFDQTLLQP